MNKLSIETVHSTFLERKRQIVKIHFYYAMLKKCKDERAGTHEVKETMIPSPLKLPKKLHPCSLVYFATQ